MTDWNYDISEAPKGSYTEIYQNSRVGGYYRQKFVPDLVILATGCGAVIKSFWSDKRQNWSGLATGEQPVAWQPWPTPPEKEE